MKDEDFRTVFDPPLTIYPESNQYMELIVIQGQYYPFIYNITFDS